MTQKEVNLTIENTQTQIENNEDEYLTSNTLRIKSMSNLYRIPVFKISQQNIKLPNNSIRTFSNVKIKSCEIIPKLNNITYNNNCLRWLRKVNLEFNEKLLDKWNNNKNIINPYILGDTYPTEQWMLCSIFIEPNYYESVEALVDEINNKISVSLENLFEFTTTTTNIIKNASLNYEPTTTNEAKTLINNAQVINCNLSSLVDSESVYTTKSITYVLNGVTTTLENAIITFKGDVKIENVKLGNVSILNPEFEDNKFNIIDENVELSAEKYIYNSTLIDENKTHITNSVYEAFLTNVNCTAIIETSTTKFDEPQNITIKAANIMTFSKQIVTEVLLGRHVVYAGGSNIGIQMFIDFELQKVNDVTQYKIIKSGTIKFIYYINENVYAYEGTLVSDMSSIYSNCDITISHHITTSNNVFDDETYHMKGECTVDPDDDIVLTYSKDLKDDYVNMYYLFIGRENKEDEVLFRERTKINFNGVDYFISAYVSNVNEGEIVNNGIYNFMNTLKCNSCYIKSGLINTQDSNDISNDITYERTAENLDTIKEYSVNKNSDLLFDTYFNDLYDTYTNGGKFLTLNNNVLSDVYVFSFKLLPVTVDNLIQQNVDEYVKLNKYNIDTITTELLPKVVEYNGDDFVLTDNIFNLNEYDNGESKINTFLYTFSQTNDLSYNMNLSTVKVTVNTKSVLKYNSGYATDEINNKDIIEDIAYIIKGTYYSEFIYNGPVYTKQYYTFNNSNSTLKYNLTETNIDISRLLNDSDIYNNFVATSFNNNNIDLSILNKIRIIMTTNFDVEQKINNEDKNLVSTNETNVFEIQTSDTSKLILKNINLNITIPKDESIYVYIVGSEYNYALMNNNATLEIEYVN